MTTEVKKPVDGVFMDANGIFYTISTLGGKRQYVEYTSEMKRIDEAISKNDFATAYAKLHINTTLDGLLSRVTDSWMEPIYVAASDPDGGDFVIYILNQYSYYNNNTILTTKLKYAYDCLIEFKRTALSCLVVEMAARRNLGEFFKWLMDEPRYAKLTLQQRSDRLNYLVPVLVGANNAYMAKKWSEFCGIPYQGTSRPRGTMGFKQ